VNCLIDAQCLGKVLREESIDELRGESIYTSGYWYFLSCQAYFRSASIGALSRPFQEMSPEARAHAESRLLSLPDEIGLVSMRELAPKMAELIDPYPKLNVLAREALAAALVLSAKVILSAPFPSLQAALGAEGGESVILTERT
jgi:hypothetical protein